MHSRELFVIALFAAGATALILWQHKTHTGIMTEALGLNGVKPVANDQTVNVASPASLAGTPTRSQAMSQIAAPDPAPLITGGNWSIN